MATSHDVVIPEDLKAEMAEMLMEKRATKATLVTNMIAKAGGQPFLAYTEASMRNRVPGESRLGNSNDYSGMPVGTYPSVIKRNKTQGFDHKADATHDPDGSMGCVVYFGNNYDGEGGQECAWLMAWHTPYGGTPVKVTNFFFGIVLVYTLLITCITT